MATNNPASQPEAVRVMKQLLNQNNLEIEFRYLHPVTVQASVRNTELKMPRDSGLLSSVWAAGKSREDSLRNLAQVISGGRLVYHATGGPLRREIDVPNLPPGPGPATLTERDRAGSPRRWATRRAEAGTAFLSSLPELPDTHRTQVGTERLRIPNMPGLHARAPALHRRAPGILGTVYIQD